MSERQRRYLEARGEFPARIALSSNAVGWLASDVLVWLAKRIATGETKPTGAVARALPPVPAKPAARPAAKRLARAAQRGA